MNGWLKSILELRTAKFYVGRVSCIWKDGYEMFLSLFWKILTPVVDVPFCISKPPLLKLGKACTGTVLYTSTPYTPLGPNDPLKIFLAYYCIGFLQSTKIV